MTRVTQFMPQAAGHLPEGGQAFLAHHFFLGLPQLAGAFIHHFFKVISVFCNLLFRLFALGDHVKDGHEVSFLRTIDRDKEPHFQGFDIRLEGFGQAGQGHPGIPFQQFRVGGLDARNNFGDFFTGDSLQTGKGFKGAVNLQVEEIRRATLIDEHPAIGKAIQHILE